MEIETQTPSTREISTSNIFNFTEVLAPDVDRDPTPNLPLLHKKRNLSFSINQKNTSFYSYTKEPKDLPPRTRSSSWKSFLSRNYTSPQIQPMTHLQDAIDNIKQKVENEFQQSRDISTFINNIKDLERSKHIRLYMSELGKQVVLKKQQYNEIHSEVVQRQEKLKKLEEKLQLLEDEENETNNLLDVYNFRREEYHDFVQGLNNEVYYQDTLKFMLACRQENAIVMAHPVNVNNIKLKQLNRECKNMEKELARYVSKFGEINKQIEAITQETEKEKIEMEKKMQSELKVFEDYQKIKKCISFEHNRNVTIERQQNNAVQLLRFERRIGELKEEHIIQDEAMKVEKIQENCEYKFKAIQRVTNIATIQDMLPYYKYLLEKKENLISTVGQLQNQIEALQEEREELIKEVDFWKFRDDAYINISIEEANKANEELEKKIEEIVRSENNLHKLQELVNSSINVLSRVVFQLSEGERSAMEVNEKNLSRVLAFICTRLDKMMEVLQNHQNVFYVESINTGMEFVSAPSFLRLNNYRQTKISYDDRFAFTYEEEEADKKNAQKS
ncbi:unnamed protein product [Blepharisma stoltei]|uniref:Uncharacterized protein n=1 Tax=Blepharisma stoltei TaxID=1481888 RepID=A0AAU9K7V4_9CILI|nr:unnamed protein product [Blepharisma stoltei]